MGQLLNGVLTMDVELEDPTGHVWNLHGDAAGDEGVTLEGLDNIDATIDYSLDGDAFQVGERVVGWRIDAIKPTIKVAISTARHVDALINWTAALNAQGTWKLIMRDPVRGDERTLKMRLSRHTGATEGDPYISGMIISDYTFVAPEATWYGGVQRLRHGGSWVNDGPLEPVLSLIWGKAGSVSLTVPGDRGGVWTGPLPRPVKDDPWQSILSIDSRMIVFDKDGAGLPVPSSSFRNNWFSLRVGSGQTLNFTTSGGTDAYLDITPRYLSPY